MSNPVVAGHANHVFLSGVLQERGVLRYTPSGQAVIDLLLQHRSQRHEAGVFRHVSAEVVMVALGDVACSLACVELGTLVEVQGFLAARSMRSRQLSLHIETFRIVERDHNGRCENEKNSAR